jgi:hypothetical protein
MEDAIQLFTGHLALVGLVVMLVGSWVAWPRPLVFGSRRLTLISLSNLQMFFGLVMALLGLILLVIGVVSHPVY